MDVPNAAIVSNRAPKPNDKAPLGQIWVDKPTNDVYILTSVVANTATWVSVGGGSGTFADITVNPGDITVTAGDINITLGSLFAGDSITAGTGPIIATEGNIIATQGNISATLGEIDGVQVIATGDLGSGTVSTTGFTNVVNTTQDVGTLTILSTTGNPGDNAGFLKIYVGTTIAYVPYFTNIAP